MINVLILIMMVVNQLPANAGVIIVNSSINIGVVISFDGKQVWIKNKGGKEIKLCRFHLESPAANLTIGQQIQFRMPTNVIARSDQCNK